MLKIRRLYSEGSYETPFDKNIDGFEEKWWSQLVFDAMSSRDEFYSFTNEAEEEVARAWVDWRDYADTYAGINIDHEESYRYLYLFEVRRDCRERGIGREAVELLASGFDYLTLLALPEAVGFWEKTSFVHYERIGTQDPREQQLFVCGHLPQ